MVKPAPDPDLEDPCRLGIAIAVALAPGGQVRFVDLGRGLGLTEGNLASHVRRLVHAGLVEVRRNGARGRASRTDLSLSTMGRARLAAVGKAMETRARAISAALTRPGLPDATAIRLLPVDATVGPGAAAPSVAEVQSPDYTLVDERFSGPD